MMIPGYFSEKEVLAAFGMSRQNFYQSGLAKLVPSHRVGRSKLYAAPDVNLWRGWLLFRRAQIALGRWGATTPLVPPDGKLPWYIASGEYIWECPRCGGTAWSTPEPGDDRLWCPVDGVIEP